MNTQLKEIHDEIVRMDRDLTTWMASPEATDEDRSRMSAKRAVLSDLLSFVDSRPETEIEMPKSVICKETLEAYLENAINQQQRVVLIYVQDKCFEGGKLNAYKEILEDVKRCSYGKCRYVPGGRKKGFP